MDTFWICVAHRWAVPPVARRTLIRATIARAEQRGYDRGMTDAVEFLRERARQHHNQVGDARRRGAMNAAANELQVMAKEARR